MSNTRLPYPSVLIRVITVLALGAVGMYELLVTRPPWQLGVIRSVSLAREISKADSRPRHDVLVLTQQDGHRIACPVELDMRLGALKTSPKSRDCYGVIVGQLEAIPKQARFGFAGRSSLKIGQDASVIIDPTPVGTSTVRIRIEGLIGAGASSAVKGSFQVRDIFDFIE